MIKVPFSAIIIVALCFIAGNFAWESWVGSQNFEEAILRAVFPLLALFGVLVSALVVAVTSGIPEEFKWITLGVVKDLGQGWSHTIGKEIEKRTGKWVVGMGTLLGALHGLEAKGYLSASWEEPSPTDRPQRRYYEITPKGRQALAVYLRELVAGYSQTPFESET